MLRCNISTRLIKSDKFNTNSTDINPSTVKLKMWIKKFHTAYKHEERKTLNQCLRSGETLVKVTATLSISARW
jgi:hypothetical protein